MAEKKTTTKATPKATKSVAKKTATKKEVARKVASATEKVEAAVVAPKTTTKTGSLKIDVLDTKGKVVEAITLPKEIFGAKVNPTLMAQAVRVYLANQRLGTGSTKTRGEVDGSTRKIYRQKGTGRARHGGIRAPIFVKGGIAHGPKPKDHSLALSKAMRQAALVSALSAKVTASEVGIISGLAKLDTKTSEMAKALTFSGYSKKGKMLLVLPEHNGGLYKALRNLAGLTVTPANLLTTFAVLDAKKVVFMQEAVEKVNAVAEDKEKKNA